MGAARSIPTVQISDGAGGHLVINQSDFDPAQHALFGGAVVPAAAPVVASAPLPVEADEYEDLADSSDAEYVAEIDAVIASKRSHHHKAGK